MKRNKFVTAMLAFLLLLALFAIPAAAAAGKVVNVTKGVSYDSIQDAVDAAKKGDIIELAAGTYEQTDVITIDKALTLRSAAGAKAVIEAGSSQPSVIAVHSPGVILKGLTVTGAASRSISIDFDEPAFSSETATRKFTLSGCTLEGDDSTHSAVALYGTIKNAEIVLEGNTVRNYTNYGLMSDSADSFTDSTIKVLDNVFENAGKYGIDLDIPAIGTDILIAGNKVTAKNEAVYLNEILGGSSLTIKDNTITSGYEGIYFSDDIVESTVTIEGNTITSGYEGIYFSDDIKESTVTIKGNTITSEEDEGIDFSDDIVESTVLIEGNTITSEEEEGIRFDYYLEDSTVTIKGNSITSADDAIFFYYDVVNSELNISGNTILSGEGRGIYFDDDIEESTVLIEGNTITSEEDEGIYFSDDIVESTITIKGNTIISEDEGIDFSDYIKESTVTIKGNSITSSGEAILFYYDVVNSELNISGNTILSGEGCGIYFDDDLDGCTITIKGNAITAQKGIYFYCNGVDSQVSIAGNIFKDNEVGIYLECGDGLDFYIAFNAFIGNDDDITLDGPANLSALLNWWGAAEGPTGLDEKIAFDPWLAVLDLTSDKAEGVLGENRTVTARLLDNTGALAETDLLAVRFTVTGAHNLAEVVPMVNGEAMFQYAGNPAGVDMITAEVLFAGEDVGLSGEATQITWEAKAEPVTKPGPGEPGSELPRTSGSPGGLFTLGFILLALATLLLYRSRSVAAK